MRLFMMIKGIKNDVSKFIKVVIIIKRLKIKQQVLTFEQGCELYIQDCRQRNLRQATIKHYQQSYRQFYYFFKPDMLLNQMTEDLYNAYIIYLSERLNNDVSINSYLRDLITVMHFLMKNEYLEPFKMQSIKVDKTPVETYTDEELTILLQKPNIKQCSFIEYQCYVISCLLLATGIRQHSLMELKIHDIDLENYLLSVRVTKTRKPLIIPLNQSMVDIIKEFLKYRQHRDKDDWLFCNAYGNQLKKSTSYHMLYAYNKRRGIETTGLHRYRHTFAKQWILSGGNVVVLSRLLGHSNLSTTQNYINLLTSDAAKQVNEINLLQKFTNKKYIKMR